MTAPDSDTESAPLLALTGPLATITLNRPSRRNALNDADLQTLIGHCTTINAASRVRVVLITANVRPVKPVFSAGYDVSGFDAPAARVVFADVPDAIENLRPVTVAAMNGSVYGGSTDLGLACDFRIGVAGMEFLMPAAKLGLHYYPSGMQRYVSRLGLAAAKRLFLLAETLPAQTMQELGYLDQLHSADHFAAAVDATVTRLLSMAPLASQGIKASLNEIARGHADFGVIDARVRHALESADFVEGRRAAAERRPPVFTGQ